METLLLTVTFASLVIVLVTSAALWKVARQNRERTAARVEALRTLAFADETPSMFASSVERGAAKRRWIAVTAVAAIMASVAGTALALRQTSPSGPGHAVSHPIELLMLQQTTNRHGEFIVTGQVRNSTRGESLHEVAASVVLFDQNGQFVTAEKAPLAAAVLQAGDESFFTVALPKTAGVARYRVQFRLENGSLVPHIDRRAPSVGKTAERTGHERLE